MSPALTPVLTSTAAASQASRGLCCKEAPGNSRQRKPLLLELENVLSQALSPESLGRERGGDRWYLIGSSPTLAFLRAPPRPDPGLQTAVQRGSVEQLPSGSSWPDCSTYIRSQTKKQLCINLQLQLQLSVWLGCLEFSHPSCISSDVPCTFQLALALHSCP